MTGIYGCTNLYKALEGSVTKFVLIIIPLYQHAAGASDCSHNVSCSAKDIFVKEVFSWA